MLKCLFYTNYGHVHVLNGIGIICYVQGAVRIFSSDYHINTIYLFLLTFKQVPLHKPLGTLFRVNNFL